MLLTALSFISIYTELSHTHSQTPHLQQERERESDGYPKRVVIHALIFTVASSYVRVFFSSLEGIRGKKLPLSVPQPWMFTRKLLRFLYTYGLVWVPSPPLLMAIRARDIGRELETEKKIFASLAQSQRRVSRSYLLVDLRGMKKKLFVPCTLPACPPPSPPCN